MKFQTLFIREKFYELTQALAFYASLDFQPGFADALKSTEATIDDHSICFKIPKTKGDLCQTVPSLILSQLNKFHLVTNYRQNWPVALRDARYATEEEAMKNKNNGSAALFNGIGTTPKNIADNVTVENLDADNLFFRIKIAEQIESFSSNLLGVMKLLNSAVKDVKAKYQLPGERPSLLPDIIRKAARIMNGMDPNSPPTVQANSVLEYLNFISSVNFRANEPITIFQDQGDNPEQMPQFTINFSSLQKADLLKINDFIENNLRHVFASPGAVHFIYNPDIGTAAITVNGNPAKLLEEILGKGMQQPAFHMASETLETMPLR